MKDYTDFGAFRIKQTLSNSCEITFRRKDKKETKAILYRDSIDPDCVVHKNWIASSITSRSDRVKERKLKEITEDDRNGNDYNDDDVDEEEEDEGGGNNSDVVNDDDDDDDDKSDNEKYEGLSKSS